MPLKPYLECICCFFVVHFLSQKISNYMYIFADDTSVKITEPFFYFSNAAREYFIYAPLQIDALFVFKKGRAIYPLLFKLLNSKVEP